MTVVASSQVAPQPTTPNGLMWADVIEIALKRTDRRAETSLNLDYELLSVIQDFCSEQPWFWRRITATFNTVANNPVYELNQGLQNVEVEKIVRAYYIPGPNQKQQLSLVTDYDEMVNMVEEFDNPSAPGKFMREMGTPSSIRINTPDVDGYKLRFIYWAQPATSLGSLPNTIPLVPAHLHHILVKGLERTCLRYTIGEKSPKYAVADAEYKSLVARASTNKDGVVGVVREYISAEPGIRSTNLIGRR